VVPGAAIVVIVLRVVELVIVRQLRRQRRLLAPKARSGRIATCQDR
jgi:hypothetical protein